jgi:hypothetical protein
VWGATGRSGHLLRPQVAIGQTVRYIGPGIRLVFRPTICFSKKKQILLDVASKYLFDSWTQRDKHLALSYLINGGAAPVTEG